MSLIHNERTKLSATALNGVAVASIVAGFITPLAAASFGVPGPAGRSLAVTLAAAVGWLVVGLCLHLAARRLLRELRE
ncbi:MAG TPA: hypothetical protein VEA41_15445 [Salinarimonas sp.]|nr:hypothetical protein [Salinarimonas sp.]